MNLVFLKVSLESSSVKKKGLLLLRRTVFEGNTIKSLTVFTLLYVCILLLCIFGLLFPLLRGDPYRGLKQWCLLWLLTESLLAPTGHCNGRDMCLLVLP